MAKRAVPRIRFMSLPREIGKAGRRHHLPLVVWAKVEWRGGEFEVKLYRNGKAREAETYYTDDLQDACHTAIAMADTAKGR